MARLVREQWSIQAHHHATRPFGEDAAASRTGSGPVNLATIRAAITDAGYLHIREGRPRAYRRAVNSAAFARSTV